MISALNLDSFLKKCKRVGNCESIQIFKIIPSSLTSDMETNSFRKNIITTNKPCTKSNYFNSLLNQFLIHLKLFKTSNAANTVANV